MMRIFVKSCEMISTRKILIYKFKKIYRTSETSKKSVEQVRRQKMRCQKSETFHFFESSAGRISETLKNKDVSSLFDKIQQLSCPFDFVLLRPKLTVIQIKDQN